MQLYNIPYLIKGSSFTDERGKISFVNDFEFNNVKRFYIIKHFNKTIRAWQGHQKEEKYFYAITGTFLVNLIKIDNWQSPSKLINPTQFYLNTNKQNILFIPKGFVNGFVNLENNSELLVFSTTTLKESIKDDYRYDKNYFTNAKWESEFEQKIN